VEVIGCNGDDVDELLDKAGLYLHLRDFLDLAMLETEEFTRGKLPTDPVHPNLPGTGNGRTRREITSVRACFRAQRGMRW
jgi:hypothetical protein